MPKNRKLFPPARIANLVHRYTVYTIPANATGPVLEGIGIERLPVQHRIFVECTPEAMRCAVDWLSYGSINRDNRLEIWAGLRLMWEINNGLITYHGGDGGTFDAKKPKGDNSP